MIDYEGEIINLLKKMTKKEQRLLLIFILNMVGNEPGQV